MFIRSLTLSGNKRLLPADIKYFHADFTNIHQIILGLNGSGKSSTVQELNPMPATPSDYIKGGYKHIVIEHNQQTYELLSLIDTHSRHSFKLNDIELNEGGTSSVQKVLVEEHFGLDQSLIEVLTDQSRFHLFSPLERRNWLTRLSGTNMDFAIGLFKHIKGLRRDSEAVVKHINARLAKESSDIVSPEELTELENECRDLEATVLKMLEHKSVNETHPEQTLKELERLTVDCKALSEHIVSLSFQKPLDGIYDRNRLGEYKQYITSQLDTLVAQKQELVNEWSAINDAIKTVEMSDNKDIGEIDAEKRALQDKIGQHKSTLITYKEVSNPEPLLGATDAIKNTFIHMVTELSDNSDGTFTRDKVEAAKERVESLRTDIRVIGNKIEQTRISIGRMVETEEVHCPECATVFKPGVDPAIVEGLKQKVETFNTQMDELKQTFDNEQKYLSKAAAYTQEYRNLLKLMDDAPALAPVWKNIRDIDLKTHAPTAMLSLFDIWERDLANHLQILSFTKEISKLDGTRDKLQAVLESEVNYTHTRLNQVQEQIENNVSEQKKNRDTLKRIEESIVSHDDIISGYERLIALNNRHRGLKEKLLDDTVQQYLREVISKLNVTLANSDAKLQSIKNSRTTVLDLENQRSEAMERLKILTVLVKELNPTDGLIAKQSKLFIEQFVDQLNTVINSVWTYEMQILPCPVESEKLTYKFPIYFSATDVANPDIAKSSAAQKGIVDFAFKLVVMKYLGLEDYPLFLDELAPSLDEKHRSNIMEFVKQFIESKQCSQMFMVSHYNTSHGVFNRAETIIMDDTNMLTIPDTYNKHVTISSKTRPWADTSQGVSS